MSTAPEPPATTPENLADLSFERAEAAPGEVLEAQPTTSGAGNCAACGGGLVHEYWATGGQTLCSACAQKVTAQNTGKAGFKGLVKAWLFGCAAALLGCGVYYLVSLSGWEFGLIAILVGYMVGFAVRVGSGGYGGLGFQMMAVVLTYFAIAGTYTPYVLQGMREANQEAQDAAAGAAQEAAPEGTRAEMPGSQADGSAPTHGLADVVMFVVAFGIALAAPFMAGVQNIMGIVILAIGLWQAWKMNRRVQLALAGPYPIAPALALSVSAPSAQG